MGWLRVTEDRFIQFVEEREAKAGDLPRFRFRIWPEDGAREKLPDPRMPFGLDLSGTAITDADLKKWTDVGLKELTQLQNLRWLDLSNTQVTAAGVQELQKAWPRCQIIR
ncbi:MAG: hypothetical protein WHU94_16295 [Thermogemmata sp.]|uniref:Leucine Rich repeats (2 copies) n=1 Tax=Thermogemmata fonticola TaxID=2755323 RepID=A0A7V8VDM6_9BACT|nr:hypothetical protein [Thermogemmata fonticola]MBA2226129.1 hypothetical protein [Thermogemmata fonticola]